MSRSTFTLFVGVFSVALYLFMTIYVIMLTTFFTVGMEAALEAENGTTEETMNDLSELTDEVYGGSLLMLADFVFMFIASLLMVYGVKEERHQYIAPWVILSAIGLFFELFVVWMEIKDAESDTTIFAYVLSAVLAAAIWYPVYQYYKDLKHQAAKKAVPCSPCATEYSHVNAKYVPPTGNYECKV